MSNSMASDSRRIFRVRQHLSSGSPLEPTIGFSRAVRDEHLVFVSATAAIWPDGHVHPDVGVQARFAGSRPHARLDID
jgi:hypothetical protein